jgi:hypothetical protein
MYLRQAAAGTWHASNEQEKFRPARVGVGERCPKFKSVCGHIGAVSLVVGVMSTVLLGATAPPAHGATPIRASAKIQEQSTPKNALPIHSDIEAHAPSPNPSCVRGILTESICVYAKATFLQIDFTGFLVDGYGVVEVSGLHMYASLDVTFHWSNTDYVYTAVVPSDEYEGTACALEVIDSSEYVCDHFLLWVKGSGGGYRMSAADGAVFGAGNAVEYGSLETTASVDPVVGIASTPGGKGYWEVTRDGDVARFGDAGNYNDLPGLHVRVDDIVAIAPTSDGKGYWLIGADGGEFAFGDAGYHGSLPGLHIHVDDIVGMVATPNGHGYILVGKDGGVFVFGGLYHGSLPGLHIRVSNIVGIIPTGAETGYVLVGSDGGSFVFGTGSGYYGSLPGRHVQVSDIVGIALTPDQHGYWMVGANATVYNFGDGSFFGTPAYATSNLPITAIAAT